MDKTENAPSFDLWQFVDQFYEMNPETEAVVPNGRNLKNGMLVLVDDYKLRQDLFWLKDGRRGDEGFAKALYLARERNRWCTVTECEVYENPGEKLMVGFTAAYDDGTRRRRVVDLSVGWIVKLESIGFSDWVDTKTKVQWPNTIATTYNAQ